MVDVVVDWEGSDEEHERPFKRHTSHTDKECDCRFLYAKEEKTTTTVVSDGLLLLLLLLLNIKPETRIQRQPPQKREPMLLKVYPLGSCSFPFPLCRQNFMRSPFTSRTHIPKSMLHSVESPRSKGHGLEKHLWCVLMSLTGFVRLPARSVSIPLYTQFERGFEHLPRRSRWARTRRLQQCSKIIIIMPACWVRRRHAMQCNPRYVVHLRPCPPPPSCSACSDPVRLCGRWAEEHATRTL